MLYTIEKEQIDYIPHRSDYDRWKRRLTDEEYNQIKAEIRKRIIGKEVNVASWIPGSNWGGTAFQCIYEKACRSDYASSAMFFGLIVWEVMIEHEDNWAFIKYNREDDSSIRSMVYFRINL